MYHNALLNISVTRFHINNVTKRTVKYVISEYHIHLQCKVGGYKIYIIMRLSPSVQMYKANKQILHCCSLKKRKKKKEDYC